MKPTNRVHLNGGKRKPVPQAKTEARSTSASGPTPGAVTTTMSNQGCSLVREGSDMQALVEKIARLPNREQFESIEYFERLVPALRGSSLLGTRLNHKVVGNAELSRKLSRLTAVEQFRVAEHLERMVQLLRSSGATLVRAKQFVFIMAPATQLN